MIQLKKTIIKILTVDMLDKNTTFKIGLTFSKSTFNSHNGIFTWNSKYSLRIDYFDKDILPSSTYINIVIGKVEYAIRLNNSERRFGLFFEVCNKMPIIDVN